MGHEPNYTTVSLLGYVVDVKVFPEAVRLPATAVCFGCPRPAQKRGEGLALPATSPGKSSFPPDSSTLRLLAEVT